jgi:PTH1 family peptidyl-tRNA hydrolase
MKIIAGLGNPGLRYRNTRHNVGFLVLKELAKRHRFNIRKKAFGGRYGIGRIAGLEVMLFEPVTYMNLSGESVKAACSRHLETMEDLLVISDDVALPLGSVRLRSKGSSGGHNGLQSIIDLMGPDFNRLRVGVGREGEIEDMTAYVLSSFPRRDRKDLEKAIQKAADCAEIWLKEGTTAAMGRYNS